MKIKNWHLIILATVIFFLDFLTLGNRKVIGDNRIINLIALVIGLLCISIFLFGAIKTLHDFFSKNKEANKIKREQEEKQGIGATGVEIGLRRLLAVLIVISVLPLIVFVPFLGWILGLPNLLLAMYLLLNRRYHPVFDGLLVMLGCLRYFFTFPGNIAYFSLYKTTELSLCPGLIDSFGAEVLSLMSGLMAFIFLAASMFLLMGDIIARFKFTRKRKWNIISLGAIFLVLFFVPYLYVPKVAMGEATSGGTGGGKGPLQHFLAFNTQFHMSYDQTINSYVFTAQMPNQDGGNSASITNICVDGKLIPITKENNMLQVSNGTIANGKISVASGQTAVIKLTSQKPFYVISLFEGIFHYSNGFLR